MNNISTKVALSLIGVTVLSGASGSCWSKPDGLETGGSAVVEGVLWDDANSNGQWDDNEQSLPGEVVRVRSGGIVVASQTTASNGTFSTSVPLAPGMNEFALTHNGVNASQQSLFRTRVEDLASRTRGSEQFCIVYDDPNARQEMASWVSSIDTSQLPWWAQIIATQGFQGGVEKHMLATLQRKFRAQGVPAHFFVGNTCALAHGSVIKMRSYSLQEPKSLPDGGVRMATVLGRMQFDWLNTRRNEGWIYLGSFNERFLDQNYPVADRAEDLGRYVGNVVAHEAGHSLGMVGDGLQGSGNHNDPGGRAAQYRQYDREIMDVGMAYPDGAEIQVKRTEGVTTKLPGRLDTTWNAVNTDYLSHMP